MLFLSIDFGTSSVKVSLLDETLAEKQTSQAGYPYIISPGEKNEINPDALLKGLSTSVNALSPDLRQQVEYVCYDTFSPSPVFLKEDGSFAYPAITTHLDRRSRPQGDFIARTFGLEPFLDIVGFYPFAGGAGIMTIIWFAQNQPEVLRNTDRIGHLTTFIHHHFTGRWMVDLVNASMLGLYETTKQGTWSVELLKAFDLDPGWFSEIKIPGTPFGYLRREVAAELGLRAGIPVAVGTNDAAAAHLGAGNKKAGQIINTAGSSDMISILTDQPITNARYYLRNAALPGLWQIYATTCGGFGLEWFYEQFCQDMNKTTFYEEFIPKSLRRWEIDGSVTFDPYLAEDRQSMEKRTGAWHGLTLATTREEMLAAMLKSMNRVLNATVVEAGKTVNLHREIKVTGGLVSHDLLALKGREIPGFEFDVVTNCTVLGNVELVKHYWKH